MNIRSNIFGSGNSASEEPLLKGKQPKGAKAEPLANVGFDLGTEMGKRADGTGELAKGNLLPRPQKPLAMAMFALGVFVAAAVGQELFRGVRVRRTMSTRPRRTSGSPPVKRTSRTPRRSTPIVIRRTTSSSVSVSSCGSQSRPSAGMQYEQRRLHRSVSETRRSVATRPYASASGRCVLIAASLGGATPRSSLSSG